MLTTFSTRHVRRTTTKIEGEREGEKTIQEEAHHHRKPWIKA